MIGSLQFKLIALCMSAVLVAEVLMVIVLTMTAPEAPSPLPDAEAGEVSAHSGQLAWLILPCIAGLGIAGLIGALFARSTLVKPLNRIGNTLHEIETHWDLTHQIEAIPAGEVGEASRAVNRFLQRLGMLLQELSQATDQLAAASNRISSASTDTADGVEHQAKMLSQVAATVLDMSHDVEEISKVALNVASNAGRSREVAEEGSQIVSDAAAGMEAIKVAVRETSNSVNGLGERSRQIGEVIEVIGDIADQTNLLALNAAIEAARAGEHGRGFAVVADEVRKLAERTSRATGEVTEVIASIQGETSRAVQRMGTVAETVEEGVERATSASHSLLEIVAATQEVSSMVERIAAAAADQNAKSRSISTDIKEISSMSKTLTTGADESAAAARNMAETAQSLRVVTSQFTVPGGAAGSANRHNVMHTLIGLSRRDVEGEMFETTRIRDASSSRQMERVDGNKRS